MAIAYDRVSAVQRQEVNAAATILIGVGVLLGVLVFLAGRELEQDGLKVALCKLRVFRPFPTAAVREALEGCARVAVLERNISLGREGIFCSEVKAALVNSPAPPKVQLDFLHFQSFSGGIVLDLITGNLAGAEIARLRMREIPAGHR